MKGCHFDEYNESESHTNHFDIVTGIHVILNVSFGYECRVWTCLFEIR
jgi:hypothetical protein